MSPHSRSLSNATVKMPSPKALRGKNFDPMESSTKTPQISKRLLRVQIQNSEDNLYSADQSLETEESGVVAMAAKGGGG